MESGIFEKKTVRVNQNNRVWKLIGANMFFLFLIALIFFIGVPSGDLIGTFTSNVYSVYCVVAIACLLFVDLLFGIEMVITKDDKKLGDGLLFVSQGEAPSISWMSNISNYKILFGTIGIMSAISTFIFIVFGDLGKVAYTHSPAVDIFMVLLENIMFVFVIAIFVFLMRLLARKKNWNKATFMVICWLGVISLGAIFGWFMHMYSKSGDAMGLIYSSVFWAVMGLIHLLTGSIFAPTGFHFIIDLPFFLNTILSNAWVITIFIILTVVSIVLVFKSNGRNIAVMNAGNGTKKFPKDFSKDSQKVYEEIFTE